jgi:hypothetical protein
VADPGFRKAHRHFLNHRLHRTQTAYNKLSILLEIRAYEYLYKAQDCLPFKADDCLPRQADRFPLRELYYYRPYQYLLYREDGYLDCRLTHDLKRVRFGDRFLRNFHLYESRLELHHKLKFPTQDKLKFPAQGNLNLLAQDYYLLYEIHQSKKALLEGGLSASDLNIQCNQALLRDKISASDSVIKRPTNSAILYLESVPTKDVRQPPMKRWVECNPEIRLSDPLRTWSKAIKTQRYFAVK